MKYQNIRLWFLAGLAIFIMMAAAVSIAQAADISIGGGAGMVPDYEGSDDYKIVPLASAKLTLENGMYLNLQGFNVKANLIPSKIWRLGPI
jgi:outer membrane scaffolding protein for murein synthesis (MipA/OmpV family)